MRNDFNTVQPIFLDIIIKLWICRAYVSNMKKMPLTAEKYLVKAEEMVVSIKDFDEINEPSRIGFVDRETSASYFKAR